MKIALYYEDKFHPAVLDVPDEECTVMIEADYQERLDAAEDKTTVKRRTAQEILDAEVNAPTFRRNRTETRRHVHLSADNLDRQTETAIPDVPTALLGEDYSELHHAIAQLRPQQRELLRRVFWEGVRQSEIACQEGWKAPYRSGCGASISGSGNSCPTRKIFYETMKFCVTRGS